MGEKRKHSVDGEQERGDPFFIDPYPGNSSRAAPPRMDQPDEFITRERRFADLYSKPPDFKHLATLDPNFAAMAKGRELDFNDPKAVMQLTRTLLKVDFDLEIELSEDRLCPPVTNRHNYIQWLKGLLDSSTYEKPGGKLAGLDIGTGASCIYPLLGCTQRPWSFIATDIDAKSLEFAKRNVEVNNLQSRINVVARKPEDALIPLDDLNIDTIDFTMTNPPFYGSEEEMLQRAAHKSRPPFTVCTGAKVELVTDGGEVAFVDRILQESLALRERVQWYTAMFGFLSSLTGFVEKLRECKIDNFAVTEFVQGSKTRRWAVAWSFQAMRPSQDVAQGKKFPISKNILPPVTEREVCRMPRPENIRDLADRLCAAISQLDLMSWEWDRERLEGLGRAGGRVWGRAWRRQGKREMNGHQQELRVVKEAKEGKDLFGFQVCMHVGQDEVTASCRWREGHDPVTFESFQGYLRRFLQDLAKDSK